MKGNECAASDGGIFLDTFEAELTSAAYPVALRHVVGGYLAAQTDAGHFTTERARDERESQELPETEAAEVAQVFRGNGLLEDAVHHRLRRTCVPLRLRKHRHAITDSLPGG